MKIGINKSNLPFMSVEVFFWSAQAVYYPFFVPFLKSSGFDELTIGIISSVLSFVGILGPVLWGAVSDRVRNTKAILAANLLAGCLVMQFIPASVPTLALLFVVLITVNMTVFPQGSVMDGWIMRRIGRGEPINYGLIRGTGSLAYALMSMAAGLVLSRFGLATMFPITFGLMGIAVVFMLLVKTAPAGEVHSAQVVQAPEPEKPIFHNAPYLVFVGLATLLYVGGTASMNFYWILLEGAGGTPADLGLANCLMALSEFPVMFLSYKLMKRFKDTALLLFAMAFYAVRILLFFALNSVTGLVLAQITNSLSFGLFLPVSVHYISRITPGRMKTTALSLASSMYMGVGGILGNLMGGVVIKELGIRTMYGLAGVVAVVAAAAFGVVLFVMERKKSVRDLRPGLD
jgi:PPP family 3-phenylpropionic acid transporter